MFKKLCHNFLMASKHVAQHRFCRFVIKGQILTVSIKPVLYTAL